MLYLIAMQSATGKDQSTNVWRFATTTAAYSLVVSSPSIAIYTLWKSVIFPPFDSGINGPVTPTQTPSPSVTLTYTLSSTFTGTGTPSRTQGPLDANNLLVLRIGNGTQGLLGGNCTA